jgi:hypothetical protein
VHVAVLLSRSTTDAAAGVERVTRVHATVALLSCVPRGRFRFVIDPAAADAFVHDPDAPMQWHIVCQVVVPTVDLEMCVQLPCRRLSQALRRPEAGCAVVAADASVRPSCVQAPMPRLPGAATRAAHDAMWTRVLVSA